MFGLSFGEVVIIAILALLLLGPDKLPEAAKTLGKGLREIRRATDELKDQVESELYSDVKKPARPALVPPVPAQPPVPGPAGPPPAATAENVPGLDVALAEPPAPASAPAPAPASDAPASPEPAPRPGPTVTAPLPTVSPPASDPDRTA
ncbi:MAG TPA: twin-arginine translocase TatA/TatE family subunit [Anaeromyxobacter sp.]